MKKHKNGNTLKDKIYYSIELDVQQNTAMLHRPIGTTNEHPTLKVLLFFLKDTNNLPFNATSWSLYWLPKYYAGPALVIISEFGGTQYWHIAIPVRDKHRIPDLEDMVKQSGLEPIWPQEIFDKLFEAMQNPAPPFPEQNLNAILSPEEIDELFEDTD